MDDFSDLRASLDALIDAVLQIVSDPKLEPRFRPRITTVQLVPDLSLLLSGPIAHTWPVARSEEVIAIDNLEQFCEEQLSPLPQYQSLIKNLQQLQTPVDSKVAVAMLVHSCIQVKFPADRISVVADWTAALLGQPFRWTGKALLSGVSIEGSTLDIDDCLRLRHPVPDDFLERISENIPRFPRPTTHFSCVAEIKTLSLYGGEVQRKIESLASVLSFYDLASAGVPRYSFRANTLRMVGGGELQSGAPVGVRFTSTISASDIPLIREALENWAGIIPTPLDTTFDAVGIAVNRYREALFGLGPWERVIFSAVSSLEALLSTSGVELQYRLANRCALILKETGRDGISVRNTLKEAYGIRSKYAHGEYVNREKDLSPLARATADISRQVIIVASQLIPEYGKSKFLELLDDSMVNDERRTSLALLVFGVWMPKRPSARPEGGSNTPAN
jgi:hypothetical protein